MSRFVFPYGIRFREESVVETFPMAELDVLGKNGAGLRALFHIFEEKKSRTALLANATTQARAISKTLDKVSWGRK